MNEKLLREIVKRFEIVEKNFMNHLIESGGIKAWLKINTWLTGVILAAILTQWVRGFFK